MMARRTLPRREDRWSDGCSVPRLARAFLPEERGETRQCCVRHDEAYDYDPKPALLENPEGSGS